MQFVLPCDACSVSGKKITSPCGACGGNGRVRKQKTQDIDIPPGIDNGHTLRVRAAGSTGSASKSMPGDLFVQVQVAKSTTFERRENDVYVQVDVPFYKALLGGQVRVPTIDGDVNLQIKAGVKEGDRMVMGGRGVPLLNAAFSSMARRGDQYNVLHITLPK